MGLYWNFEKSNKHWNYKSFPLRKNILNFTLDFQYCSILRYLFPKNCENDGKHLENLLIWFYSRDYYDRIKIKIFFWKHVFTRFVIQSLIKKIFGSVNFLLDRFSFCKRLQIVSLGILVMRHSPEGSLQVICVFWWTI